MSSNSSILDRFDSAIRACLKGSILNDFPPEALNLVLTDALRVEIPAGSVIYREDAEPRCGLVVDGLIRVFMTSPNGREVTVRYATSGELLGVPVTMGGPAPVNVQMLTDTVVLFLNAGVLQRLGQTEPTIGWLMGQEVTRRLYDTLEGLAAATFGTLRQQIARHLLDIAVGSRTDRRLIASITQQELADAVGSVRPAVSRIIGELRSEGLVETTPDGIVVLDPLKLHEQTWFRGA